MSPEERDLFLAGAMAGLTLGVLLFGGCVLIARWQDDAVSESAGCEAKSE